MCSDCCSDPSCSYPIGKLIGREMVDLEWAISIAKTEPLLSQNKAGLRHILSWIRCLILKAKLPGWLRRYEDIRQLVYPEQEKPAKELATEIWKHIGR